MPDPATGGIGTSLALTATKKLIEKLIDGAVGAAKDRLVKWKTDARITKLHKRCQAVRKVKTVWQVEKEVDLHEFYYPSRLRHEKKIIPVVQNLSSLPQGHPVLIQGVAGQGKSTFLRYLCATEMKRGESLPLFLELRKYQPAVQFRGHLLAQMEALGFASDQSVLDYLAAAGRLSLFLDGFDETNPSVRSQLIGEIESFHEKYPNVAIVVTSRKDSDIEHSRVFRLLEVDPLKRPDVDQLIKKLMPADPIVNEILEAIKTSDHKIEALLTTPLLVTLLVIVYKAAQRIPSNLPEFYDAMFYLMLFRHDKTKPGFNRFRNCNLDEQGMQKVFETFCVELKIQKAGLEIAHEVAHEAAKSALVESKLDVNPDAFIKDIRSVTCLLNEEDGSLHFLHKSVGEYYSAKHIVRKPDPSVRQFYEKMRGGKWIAWRYELEFLAEIDQYRFLKYFREPELIRLQEALIQASVDKSTLEPALSLIYDGLSLVYATNGELGKDKYYYRYSPAGTWPQWEMRAQLVPLVVSMIPIRIVMKHVENKKLKSRHTLLLGHSATEVELLDLLRTGIAPEHFSTAAAKANDVVVRSLADVQKSLAMLGQTGLIDRV